MIRTACPFILLFVSLAARPATASEACDGHPRADTRPPTVYKELFAYDTAADLGVQVAGTRTAGEATVQDITFIARPDRPTERVAAFIVAPTRAPASTAGVLWVHWLGEPLTTNRTEFLAEATALAARGVTSVLVDAMWSKKLWYRDRVLEQDYATSIGQVVALRRGLDLLLKQPGVDPRRVALVGHDYGGMYGTILAAVDGRTRTQVVIAATASLLDWAFFYEKKPVSMDAYLREHEALSLCDHLANAGSTSFLFQFAEKDRFVTLAKAVALFSAPPGAKQMIVYGGEATHSMVAPAAVKSDRTLWLVRELGL
jgi:pimeloyl-ACP methyl ester carboxylesterase